MGTSTPLSLSQIFGIGLSISLEFDEHDSRVFLPSRVEDVVHNHLWVAMPMRGTMFVPLPPDTPVTAFIKHEDAMYSLDTRVRGRSLQPFPMLELLPTADIQRRQRRENVRLRLVLVPVAATLVLDSGAEVSMAAVVTDISAGGVQVRTRQPLEIGQRIHLTLELPPPGHLLSGTIQVLRVNSQRAERGLYIQRAERGLYYEAGCAFIDLTDRHRDSITKFIFHQQAQQARLQKGIPQ